VPNSAPPKSIRVVLLVWLSALALVSSCGSPPAGAPARGGQPGGEPPGAAALGVSVDRAMTHLQALQKVADENGGNRASGTRGYEASVDYAAGVLRQANLDVATPDYELSADNREDGGGSARPRNVIAQTRGGDPRHIVMIGAHLDSVAEGPGIVDDGSGVAAVLEIATRLAVAAPGGNTVRFALFGSEETGTQGSTSYVESLTDQDRDKIMLYLNVDMIASPNGGYLIQGGTGDEDSETGPTRSAEVAQVLIDNLAKTGVTAERIPFVGDDEVPFIEAGIPSAGAENGDDKKKTAAQAEAWGGESGKVYDRCYHRACDRLDNVNRTVFDHYLRAIADTVVHYTDPRNILTR
jgi:aminopeptidase S